MGLAQVMEHRRAKKHFFKARRWMEEKYGTLSTDREKFMQDFQKVCDKYDAAWVALSDAERADEKQRDQPRPTLLAEKERAEQEIPF